MSVRVTITETGQIDQQLGRVAAALRGTIVKKALRAGGRVVQKRIQADLPRSSQTGTRELWSAKTAASRSGVKPHAETIGLVVRDYGHYFVAVVGAQYPAGALYHLLEKDHKHVAWGRPSGLVLTGEPYTERAADATQAEQRAAIDGTVTSEVGKLLG